MNPTEKALNSRLKNLDDECSMETLEYTQYVIEKIRRGMKRALDDGGISQERVEQKINAWYCELEALLTNAAMGPKA
ncbi:MAG: hypothetical protein DRQ52_03870 [Gammaproteobacteria bacterium]|nr:MAG: hypothetical protein DRQ52_03870 [Gammaproteobacteria bacterium]